MLTFPRERDTFPDESAPHRSCGGWRRSNEARPERVAGSVVLLACPERRFCFARPVARPSRTATRIGSPRGTGLGLPFVSGSTQQNARCLFCARFLPRPFCFFWLPDAAAAEPPSRMSPPAIGRRIAPVPTPFLPFRARTSQARSQSTCVLLGAARDRVAHPRRCNWCSRQVGTLRCRCRALRVKSPRAAPRSSGAAPKPAEARPTQATTKCSTSSVRLQRSMSAFLNWSKLPRPRRWRGRLAGPLSTSVKVYRLASGVSSRKFELRRRRAARSTLSAVILRVEVIPKPLARRPERRRGISPKPAATPAEMSPRGSG